MGARRQSSPASGGELFTAEKFPKRAGGCGPRSPLGLSGVHPRKRPLPGCYAPPGRPAPYCLPLPGFARASGIGQSLQLQNFSLRPHELPRNAGWMLHTAVFAHKYCRPHRRSGYQPPAWPRCLSALAERTRQQFNRRGAHCASGPRQRPLAAGAVVARGRLSRRAPSPPGTACGLRQPAGIAPRTRAAIQAAPTIPPIRQACGLPPPLKPFGR